MNVGNYMMTFGLYRGRSLAAIARDRRGRLYLEWLRGDLSSRRNLPPDRQAALDAITAFFADVPKATHLRAQVATVAWRSATASDWATAQRQIEYGF